MKILMAAGYKQAGLSLVLRSAARPQHLPYREGFVEPGGDGIYRIGNEAYITVGPDQVTGGRTRPIARTTVPIEVDNILGV
ncbi:hypothetical protein JNB88_29260 [Rhizobium cauense]|uniref:hypothetical protein n=1 Tax=Rhizobium cauense TaxID=1166683 RepID=UPI001C6E08BB|nr:hypothetical protein [Rhizobium cauense]MBW9117710.1 hypothetical protein [Rhizobium cauense]